MEQEFVIQSEVSQKEKNKYRILTHIFRIWKNGTDQTIFKAGIEMQMKRTDMWAEWGKVRVEQIGRLGLM